MDTYTASHGEQESGLRSWDCRWRGGGGDRQEEKTVGVKTGVGWAGRIKVFYCNTQAPSLNSIVNSTVFIDPRSNMGQQLVRQNTLVGWGGAQRGGRACQQLPRGAGHQPKGGRDEKEAANARKWTRPPPSKQANGRVDSCPTSAQSLLLWLSEDCLHVYPATDLEQGPDGYTD